MYHPLRDIVLIQADKVKTETDSGILLQENWKTLPLWGTVLKTGPAVKSVESGDRVFYMRYASIILEDDQRLIKEGHILAKENG